MPSCLIASCIHRSACDRLRVRAEAPQGDLAPMVTAMTPEPHATASIAELRARLADVEEALRAIRSDDVDAITVETPSREQVYSRQGAEQPYREMNEAMSEGAINIMPDGMVLYCNQYFARLPR